MSESQVRLVLAFDGSPAAQRALELLAGYRGARGRLEVLAVNVQQRPVTLFPGTGIDPAALDAALGEAGRSALAPALERLAQAGIAARGEVRYGLPAPALLDDARVTDAQAIVMGTRGHGALHGFAFGSAAMRVAHGGVVPTLIVGPDGMTPLMIAAEKGNELATDELLRAGAQADLKSGGKTALDLALAEGNKRCAERLGYIEKPAP